MQTIFNPGIMGPFQMHNKIILYFFLLSLVPSGCKPKENTPPNMEPTSDSADLTFKFNSLYNNSSIVWDSFYNTMAGDTIKFAKVKYIFSNFILEKTNGDLVKVADAYGFISLSESIDSFIIENVPKGDYKSLRIEVGLDSAINHGNPQQWSLNHPLNPSLDDMLWSWSGGYIFNVVEGYYKNNGVNKAFSFHVALDKNVRIHSLSYNYTISKNSRFTMKVNTDKFFSNAINFNLKTDGSFSHSGDPDLVMDKFLQNATNIMEIKDFK